MRKFSAAVIATALMTALVLVVVLKAKKTGLPKDGKTYSAIVEKVVDGDTVNVRVPAWEGQPFERVALRVRGIDTPEKSVRFAKCAKEIKLGVLATEYARTLAVPGDHVTFVYRGKDKYFRIDADLFTPGGDKWSEKMIAKGFAKTYFGGTKVSWCGDGRN